MKIRIGLSKLMILFTMSFILFHFSSCTQINQASTPSMYWYEKPSGSIETNDSGRLQGKLPFTMVLPKYVPDGLNSYNLNMKYYQVPGGSHELDIYYYSLIEAKEIRITEIPTEDPLIQPLEYSFVELAGIKVLKASGSSDIIWSGKKSVVSWFSYTWKINNLQISAETLGYDQNESNKVVESMIK